jgi:hypothetical protein
MKSAWQCFFVCEIEGVCVKSHARTWLVLYNRYGGIDVASLRGETPPWPGSLNAPPGQGSVAGLNGKARGGGLSVLRNIFLKM